MNRKVVERLHRLWDLPLRCTVTRPKPSAVRRAIDAAGPRANLLSGRSKAKLGPLEVLYTDFTELHYGGGTRTAWLIPLLDHATKYVAGFALGERANSELALSAWRAAERAVVRLRGAHGRRHRPPGLGPGVHRLRVDRAAPGGGDAALLRAPRASGQSGDGELLRPVLKVENRSLILDAGSLEELAAVVRDRINYYNRVRRHSPSETGRPWRSSRTSTERAEQHNKPGGPVSNFWGSLQRLLQKMKILGSDHSEADADSFMDVWRYAGFLIGIPETIMPKSIDEALRLYDIGVMIESKPCMEAIQMAHSLCNSASILVDANVDRETAIKQSRYVYRLSRSLIGNELADALNYPKLNTFGVIGQFKFLLRGQEGGRTADSESLGDSELQQVRVPDEHIGVRPEEHQLQAPRPRLLRGVQSLVTQAGLLLALPLAEKCRRTFSAATMPLRSAPSTPGM